MKAYAMDGQAVDAGLDVIGHLGDAMNAHDLEALVAVFDPDVVSETPAHPQRTFHGADQVRGTGDDFRRGSRSARGAARYRHTRGHSLHPWDWSGTRRDGCGPPHARRHHPAGRRRARAVSVRFYMEPVEEGGPGPAEAVRMIVYRRHTIRNGGPPMILSPAGRARSGVPSFPFSWRPGEPIRVLTRGEGAARRRRSQASRWWTGDVRDAASVARAMAGIRTVVSAIQEFGGPGRRRRSRHRPRWQYRARGRSRAGACRPRRSGLDPNRVDGPPHRALPDEGRGRGPPEGSGVSWTIVRPTACQETWLDMIGGPLVSTSWTRIFGRGRNPINFVSAEDVARVVEQAVVDPALRMARPSTSRAPRTCRSTPSWRSSGPPRRRDGSVSHGPTSDAWPDVPHPSADQARPGEPDLGGGGDGIPRHVRRHGPIGCDNSRQSRARRLADVARRRLGAVTEGSSLRSSSAPELTLAGRRASTLSVIGGHDQRLRCHTSEEGSGVTRDDGGTRPGGDHRWRRRGHVHRLPPDRAGAGRTSCSSIGPS